jgi:hypothetical protein
MGRELTGNGGCAREVVLSFLFVASLPIGIHKLTTGARIRWAVAFVLSCLHIIITEVVL